MQSFIYCANSLKSIFRKENTYLNLDLTVDNEEKQYHDVKRDSIAFVQEISSVDNCSTVNENVKYILVVRL